MITHAGNSCFVTLLGISQDGGLPHIGCTCPRCENARSKGGEPEAALAIVDTRAETPNIWLVDATPSIRQQLHMLAPLLGQHPSRPGRLRQPNAIFLTHSHMGHINGLQQLGPEGMSVESLPVYASSALCKALKESVLAKPLLSCIELRELSSDQPINLAPDLTLIPLSVPHRDESGTGTFGFLIQGPEHSVLYVPDIDRWESWPEANQYVSEADVALLDATFWSEAELNGRPRVAHPLVQETVETFRDVAQKLVLIHLNHTNPILDHGSVERKAIESQGIAIGYTSQSFPL